MFLVDVCECCEFIEPAQFCLECDGCEECCMCEDLNWVTIKK